MRYVLLFFAWLTLCCSSLSASEASTYTSKEIQINVSKVTVSKKKKAPVYAKIKLHSTKARLFLSESIIPEFPFSLKKTLHVFTEKAPRWKTSDNFSYHYIFGYLYPKHAFW